MDMQVSLLNQEIIIEKIQSVVESKLRNSNDTRTFQEQVKLHSVAVYGLQVSARSDLRIKDS